MIGSEIRQARKGATVVADSCAGMWLSGLPPTTRLRLVGVTLIATCLDSVCFCHPCAGVSFVSFK